MCGACGSSDVSDVNAGSLVAAEPTDTPGGVAAAEPLPDLVYSYNEPDLSRDTRNQELLEIHMLFFNGASNDIMHQEGKYTVRWPRVAAFEVELHGSDPEVCNASVVDRSDRGAPVETILPGEPQSFQASGQQLVWIQGGCDQATVTAWESDETLPEPSL